MKTLNFARTADVFVLVHSKDTPDQAEWNAYIAAVTGARREIQIAGLLVVTPGGVPNAPQRAQIAVAYGDATTLTAVCSGTPVVDRVITVIGWITSTRIRGFRHDDLVGAMAYLAIAPAQQRKLAEVVATLHAELGIHHVPT